MVNVDKFLEKKFMRWLFLIILSLLNAHCTPRILVTIPPLHSITCSIMAGVAVPDLLLTGFESPHHFTLKSSHVKKISHADFIFWIGPELESFLLKPLHVNTKQNLAFINLPAINKKSVRYSCDHHSKHHTQWDPHIWLDLNNAIIMTQTIAQKLIDLDPVHQMTYQKNALALIDRIKKKQIEWAAHQATALQNYISFHDAYQYLESTLPWRNVGVIKSDAQGSMSLKKFNQMQDIIIQQHVTAIFSEPQNTSKLIKQLAMQHHLCHYELDPLGAGLTAGPDMYLKLMQQLYQIFNRCNKKQVIIDAS